MDITVSECGRSCDSYAYSGITSITMDESVLGYEYSKGMFRGMKNLKSIHITNPRGYGYYSVDGVLYWTKDKKKYNNDDLLCFPAQKSYVGNYTMPKWCKCYYLYAFEDCKFTTVTVPENVTSEFYWDTAWSDEEEQEFGIVKYFNGKFRVLGYSNSVYGMSVKALNNYKSWTKNKFVGYKGNTYKIKYVLNGGKNHPKNPTKYRAGEKPFALGDPTTKKKGLVFYGWKCSKTKNEYEDLTYTAVWGKKIKKTSGLKIKKVKGKKKKYIISWKKIKGIKKYEIGYFTKKEMQKMKRSNRGWYSSVTVKKNKYKTELSSNTAYIAVRAVKKKNGVEAYGKWSKFIKVK